MKKITLSAPQLQLLREAARETGTSAVESFAPRRKLVELGLVYVVAGKFGSETLRATEAGVDYLAALDAGGPTPLTDWQRDQLHWMTTSNVTDVTSPGQMTKMLERGLVNCSGEPSDPKSIWSITDAGRRAVAGYRR